MTLGNHTSLLSKYGTVALLSDLKYSDCVRAAQLLQPLFEVTDGPRSTAAIAYLVGIKQGVHDERARRQATAAQATTRNKSLNVRLADEVMNAGLSLERAEIVLQDVAERYFTGGDPDNEDDRFHILYARDRYRVKAEIVQDYLFKLRKQIKVLATLVERGVDEDQDVKAAV